MARCARALGWTGWARCRRAGPKKSSRRVCVVVCREAAVGSDRTLGGISKGHWPRKPTQRRPYLALAELAHDGQQRLVGLSLVPPKAIHQECGHRAFAIGRRTRLSVKEACSTSHPHAHILHSAGAGSGYLRRPSRSGVAGTKGSVESSTVGSRYACATCGSGNSGGMNSFALALACSGPPHPARRRAVTVVVAVSRPALAAQRCAYEALAEGRARRGRVRLAGLRLAPPPRKLGEAVGSRKLFQNLAPAPPHPAKRSAHPPIVNGLQGSIALVRPPRTSSAQTPPMPGRPSV